MTDKQKEALEILFQLRKENRIGDEQYYKLMEFVVSQTQQAPIYIPYHDPQPFTPWVTQPYTVTCNAQK